MKTHRKPRLILTILGGAIFLSCQDGAEVTRNRTSQGKFNKIESTANPAKAPVADEASSADANEGSGQTTTKENNANTVDSEISEEVFVPEIKIQSAEVQYVPGEAVELKVEVTSDSPVTIAWFKDGTLIEEEVDPTFTIAESSGSDVGVYTVTAKNSAGEVESKPISILPQAKGPEVVNFAESIVDLVEIQMDEAAESLTACYKFKSAAGIYPSEKVALIAKYLITFKVDGIDLDLEKFELLSRQAPNPYFYSTKSKCFEFSMAAADLADLKAKYPLGNIPFETVVRGGISKNGPPITGGIRSIVDASKAAGYLFIGN